MILTFGGTDGLTVPAGHQLVLWSYSDNAQGQQYAYDTISYPSRIRFDGEW